MKTDFLVIGQGLAGTCLTVCLQRAGKSVMVIDADPEVSSSKIAAGFLHPITGRRIVKTWMADQLFPFAETFYRSTEKESGKKFFHAMDSLEMVGDIKSLNDWSERSADPTFREFIAGEKNPNDFPQLHTCLKLFRVRQGGWLDIPAFLKHHQEKWEKEGIRRTLELDPQLLSEPESLRQSLEVDADQIIYCEGHRARFNTLWSRLPFDPAKGEILTVEIPGLPEDSILVNGLFIIPLGKGQFRVGSTYSWHALDELPTVVAAEALSEKLARTVNLPFKIISHKAGIRPAVKGRRPLIGKHPERTDCWIFNGLGSKGGSLAPWFADHLTRHLVHGEMLSEDVNINRFPEGPGK
jgi:glycine/D-amino acid oxidase-like deaminating enzyme